MPIRTNKSLMTQIADEVYSILRQHSALPQVLPGLVFPTNVQRLAVIFYFVPVDNNRQSGTNVQNNVYRTKLLWRMVRRGNSRRDEHVLELSQHLYEARNLFHLLRPQDLSQNIDGFFQTTARVDELFAEEADPEYGAIDAAIGEMTVDWEFFEVLK